MKLRKSLWLFLVLTLAMSLFLAACSGGGEKASGDTEKEEPKEETPAKEEPKNTEPVTGGDLVIGSAGSPTLFNPYFSTDTASSDIEGLVYNALIKTNKNLEDEYDLAEDIQQSEDGLEFTVKLREDVKWHDGEQMDADDLVFAYELMKKPEVVSERKSNFDSLEKIEKIDQFTVKFTLNKVDVTFYPTTLGSYGPLPEHILGDVDPATIHENEFNYKPIGTGPFKFVEWKDGEYVKVEANEDYFEGRPYLDTITTRYVADANALIAALQAGEIDMYNAFPGTELDTVKAIEGTKIEEDLALSYTFLGFNQQDERFKDKKVRQAFTHAVNKQAIVDSIMNGAGQPADAPDSPLMWTYNDDVPKFEYDLEKAKTLLKEAGWEDTNGNGIVDKDGKEMSFSIKTNQGNKVREDIAVVLQQQFKEIGVEAKPEIVEWSAFIDAVSAPNWDYEAMILGWSLSTFPDQYDIFHSSQAKEGLNMNWYSNPEADKLMEEARQTTDRDKYTQIHKDLYQILVEDQAYTFLYYPIEYRAMPEELQGYEFHPKSQLFNANKWWLQPAE
ncbi:peptide-binding protein [Bacillus sp. REN16]|uniref:peptide-binding protein n=1 Tax=Bacillus sp. REN16 TaxID=2887296 RepID=UPI001E306F87|nr:peptide-binding protein [Bacillus sp. REN16]MCC3355610.1 peptide-binding protein [Bacillus sp. REN16]